MDFRAKRTTRTASIFMEYSIIIGVVSAVLVGMNFYIKRGVQAKLKDMADYFIINEQLSGIYQTNSQTNSVTNASMDSQGYGGGGTRLALLETRNISSQSRIEDKEFLLSRAPFVPSEEGDIVISNRTDESSYIDPDWETKLEIADLKRQKEFLLAKAEALDDSADKVEKEGMKLIPGSIQNPCAGGTHGSPEWTICIKKEALLQGYDGKLLGTGIDLVVEAYNNREKADSLRNDADDIQKRIDRLEKTLKG